MNQAQAIVAAVLRIAGGLIAVWAVVISFVRKSRPLTMEELARLSPDPEVQIRMVDFAGGTVVYFQWPCLVASLSALLLAVFSKTIARIITPGYEKE